MKWFKRSEEEPEPPKEEYSVVQVDGAGLYRHVLYDSAVPNPSDIARLLNMPPMSREVEEMEEAESERRTEKLRGILPLIEVLARFSANIQTAHHASIDNTDDETADLLRRAYYGVAATTLFSGLSILNDLGLIDINVEHTFKTKVGDE